VFLAADQNLKLGDFGLSKNCENVDSLCQTFVGTPYYMSPELINESSYNSKSDIWSLGCLIYELCALEPPFQSKTQAGLSQKIREGKFNGIPSHYSSELSKIVKLSKIVYWIDSIDVDA
jgi:serine/threonine protein kinase